MLAHPHVRRHTQTRMHAHTPTDLEDEQNMGKCNMLQRAILAGTCSGHRFRSKNVLIGTSQSAWTKNFILQGLGTFEEFFFQEISGVIQICLLEHYSNSMRVSHYFILLRG